MCSLLLAIIYLSFISLGLPDSLLGSAWPAMQPELDVPLSYAGIVTMIISAGTVLSSLLSERLTHRFSTKTVTWISVLMTAAALFGFSTATHFWLLCLWAIPYGLGAGSIDAALNNYVALHYSSRQMSWLHCFWGVGTIISPYVMSYALTHGSWQSGFRIISFVQAVIVVILLASLSLWKVHQAPQASGENAPVLGLKGALRIKGVCFLLLGFLSYCAAESTVMLWASSYLSDIRNLSEEAAAAFGSLFFIGITVGRFLSGLISERLSDRTLIRLGTGISLLGILLICLPLSTDLPTLSGFVIIGLGFAPIYPCIIHSTPIHFGAENSQAIIGIQMASAYIGSTLMPPLFGILAEKLGIALLPLYLVFFAALMTLMLEKTYHVLRH